jgi:hypothetical protein
MERITVSIEIYHFEIISVLMIEHHQPVGADAETPIADPFNFLPG